MTAKLNRTRNLRRLLREFGNDLQRLADEARSSYDNLWQILHGTLLPSGKPRGIGDDLAAKLEEAGSKPPGWLDQDHDISDDAREIAKLFSRLSLRRQHELAPIILAAIGPHITDDEVEEKMPATRPLKEEKR